ncbi:MAG: hypothetical protein JNN28_04390 [Saprospiraceae bacterium]|nr:hypothetical protein [Saprospiraceae bacterium]
MIKTTTFLKLLLLFCILSCSREPIPTPSNQPQGIQLPELKVNQVQPKATKAEVFVQLLEPGNLTVRSYGCLIHTSTDPDLSNNSNNLIRSGAMNTETQFSFSGLTDNTTYFVRGYIVTSVDTVYSSSYEFKTQPHWRLLSSPYPDGTVSNTATFTINNQIYVGGGFLNKTGFWQFNPVTETWTGEAAIIEPMRGLNGLVGFPINDIGYFGTGTYLSGGTFIHTKSFWSFSKPNGWQQMPDFPGEARAAAVGFGLMGMGFIGLGDIQTGKTRDFWGYNPSTNSWFSIPDFPGGDRTEALAFVIGDKAYVGFGVDQNNTGIPDLYEFDPAKLDNPWTKITGGATPPARRSGFVFVIGNSAYIGGGSGNPGDLWKFTPNASEKWVKFGNLPMGTLSFSTGVSLGDRGMVVGGRPQTNGGNLTSQCWIFNPE